MARKKIKTCKYKTQYGSCGKKANRKGLFCTHHAIIMKKFITSYHSFCDVVWDKKFNCSESMPCDDAVKTMDYAMICKELREQWHARTDLKMDRGHQGAIDKMTKKIRKCRQYLQLCEFDTAKERGDIDKTLQHISDEDIDALLKETEKIMIETDELFARDEKKICENIRNMFTQDEIDLMERTINNVYKDQPEIQLELLRLMESGHMNGFMEVLARDTEARPIPNKVAEELEYILSNIEQQPLRSVSATEKESILNDLNNIMNVDEQILLENEENISQILDELDRMFPDEK